MIWVCNNCGLVGYYEERKKAISWLNSSYLFCGLRTAFTESFDRPSVFLAIGGSSLFINYVFLLHNKRSVVEMRRFSKILKQWLIVMNCCLSFSPMMMSLMSSLLMSLLLLFFRWCRKCSYHRTERRPWGSSGSSSTRSCWWSWHHRGLFLVGIVIGLDHGLFSPKMEFVWFAWSAQLQEMNNVVSTYRVYLVRRTTFISKRNLQKCISYYKNLHYQVSTSENCLIICIINSKHSSCLFTILSFLLLLLYQYYRE